MVAEAFGPPDQPSIAEIMRHRLSPGWSWDRAVLKVSRWAVTIVWRHFSLAAT
jgi:hypothetical protein